MALIASNKKYIQYMNLPTSQLVVGDSPMTRI